MTERIIENCIKKLSALEEQIAQLQDQADAIKGELKADLEEKGLDELKTKNFLIRRKEIVGNLIDGYTSYLLAKAHGIQRVPIRYGRRQIVRASHKFGGMEVL